MKSDYEINIGLEIHAELKTETKVFCGCKNSFGDEPNTNIYKYRYCKDNCVGCSINGFLNLCTDNNRNHSGKVAEQINKV